MEYQIVKRALSLSPFAVMLFALVCSPALAGSRVTFTENGNTPEKSATPEEEAPAWHRSLWEGSFDKAGDASGEAAKQLEGVELDCDELRKPSPSVDGKPGRPADMNHYNACLQRKEAALEYAQQARSIQSQQKVFSVISKTSDVAAVGAVGAVIYGEMGVKTNNQAGSFEQAAHIQKTAGLVNYAAGAADFTMGAYAYVAHKNKLEQMQSSISGSADGVKSNADPALGSGLANAVEASKSAAYSHMLYGAGKMAAGYASVWLAKRSQNQADKMNSIDASQYYNFQNPVLVPAALPFTPPPGANAAPYYTNNQPTFIMPDSSGVSAQTQPATGVGGNGPNLAGSSSGSSVAPLGGLIRSPASISGGKLSGGGGGDSSVASATAEDPAKEAVAKEAIGASFEAPLTGGIRSFNGGSGSSAKEEPPNLAALLGSDQGKTAATGLSPNQMYQDALEGTDGTEQGSMAGVNGKNDTSLFQITRLKLTKMFEIGNVGVSKNVEVK